MVFDNFVSNYYLPSTAWRYTFIGIVGERSKIEPRR
jgi:hypothetical protein